MPSVERIQCFRLVILLVSFYLKNDCRSRSNSSNYLKKSFNGILGKIRNKFIAARNFEYENKVRMNSGH